MCGILVYIGKNKLDKDHKSLEVIDHRGPDNAGVQCFEINNLSLTLGHKRLSIIDLSDQASQPMLLQGTKLWVTYNGEIYKL